MSMRVSQEFIEDNVINPMAKRLAELEKKIDLAVANTAFLIKEFDKATKNIKK